MRSPVTPGRLIALFLCAAVAACVGTIEGEPQTIDPPGNQPPPGGNTPDAGTPLPDPPDAGPPPANAVCTTCHGSAASPAPPKNITGGTERTARGVGAHQEHLASSTWHKAVECASCHVVPTEVSSPTHIDGDNTAEITFGALNPTATFSAKDATCSNLYCHGNGRASTGKMVFTDDVTLTCTSCHGEPSTLSGQHNRHVAQIGFTCDTCHAGEVDNKQTITDANLHIDGKRNTNIKSGGSYDAQAGGCSNLTCHNNRSW